MLIDVTPSPGTARTLEALDEAVRLLRDLSTRLGDLAARAEPIAIDADWQAPSSHAFHERLEQWRATLVTARGRAEDLADALVRARARLQVAGEASW